MWACDEPTPTKPRPRIYTIATDNDLTMEDFEMKYKWVIRRTNAQFECKFYVTAVCAADLRAVDYLRELGVSPSRVVLFCLEGWNFENKYKSEVRVWKDRAELERELVSGSTHDILWEAVPGGVTSRIARARKEKEKTRPYIETMPA